MWRVPVIIGGIFALSCVRMMPAQAPLSTTPLADGSGSPAEWATQTAIAISVLPTRAQATVQPAPAATLIDVKAWMGKPISEFESTFGKPVNSATYQAGRVGSIPNGGVGADYALPWGTLTLWSENGRIVAFMLDEFKAGKAPPTFDAALQGLGLPTGQKPNFESKIARNWDNLAGFHVKLQMSTLSPEVGLILVDRVGFN